MNISDAEYYTEWIMAFAFIASLIIPGILFIIHLLRIRKFKNTSLAKFKKTELLAVLMPFITIIEAVVIFLNTRIFFYGGKLVYAGIAITLCLLTFAEAFLLVRCRSYKNENKPEKTIILNIETVCCVLTIIGIAYWRLFQWWGF